MINNTIIKANASALDFYSRKRLLFILHIFFEDEQQHISVVPRNTKKLCPYSSTIVIFFIFCSESGLSA